MSCPHGHTQVLGHLRLAALVESKAPNNLQCSDAGCPLAKSTNTSETLAQFLKRERTEAQRQAQAEAERRKAAEAEAGEQRASQARTEALRLEYREFWLHQLKADVPEPEMPSFKQWCAFSESARRQILARNRQDASAQWKFSGLGER
ncbi:MAG: hypothetical protein ACJ71Q_09055 [Terriglobales bacterium]